MSNYTVKVCKVCGAEEKSNTTKYWSQYFGSAVASFKNVPGLQGNFDLDTICLGCAKAISTAISNTICKIKENK